VLHEISYNLYQIAMGKVIKIQFMVEFLGNTDIKLLRMFQRRFFGGHMFGILAACGMKDAGCSVT